MKGAVSYRLSLYTHPSATLIAVLLILFTDPAIINERNLSVLSPEFHTDFDGAVYKQAEIVSGESYIILPLKTAGRLFMLEAVIDGQSGNLVFDTGASGIVVNKTYFRKYVPINSHTSNGITGAVAKGDIITMGNLKASDLEMKKFQAQVADLSHIENQKGVKVLGLFGFEILRGFEIILDINSRSLQLYETNSEGIRVSDSDPDFAADYSQKFETVNGILFIRGTIAGKEMKFCLDTGAETNVIGSNAGKNVLKSISIIRKSDLNGVGTTKSEVLFGTMTDFRLGERQLSPMTTVIANLSTLREAYGTSIDGMLGYDFFKKGIFCINFPKQQIGVIYHTKK